ncbi:unnamed protein product [Adineta steineri]|uniref:Uncharacterized protein n=2 Tax=Adineta steineri TaxID=433720 RepID=A0A814LPS5_9BILA|nr:unnamed protein product [Adineta steineri]CAF3915999.1 unnamed protein product [Adineta steineri]CAF3950930.1 unnamed protein product [Adineta steineri]
MDPDYNPMSCPPVPVNQHERFKQYRQRKIILSILISITVLSMLLIVIIPCVYIFVIKPRVINPFQSSTSFTTASSTIINHKEPVCVHRQFGIITPDILYSFDCLNVTDDVSGTYNGFPAAMSQTELDNETLQRMLPSYVTPDYSGQGAALKLNSSIPYQYIELEHSPKFANQTFTISAWVKPELSALSLAVLLAQRYKNEGDNFFAVGIIDRRPRIRVYNTFTETSVQLKNSQWQYVTYTFSQSDLSMAIRIDGLLKAYGTIVSPQYGESQIETTTIGSAAEFNRYNGLIDQLSIAYRVKNRVDILDEATLVICYRFEGDIANNDSLLNDSSANCIRAQGANLSRVVGSRRTGQGTLLLNDSSLSYFQSSGFALLYTHNYTYSYALWISISNASPNLTLLHITMNDEISSSNSISTCLAMLIIDKIDPLNNTMQLSMYTYGPQGQNLIKSNVMMQQSTWYHIAVISTTNNFDLNLNAVLVGSLNTSNTFQINNEQRLSLTIGNPSNESIQNQSYSLMCHLNQKQIFSRGSSIAIDELRFYARQLKPKEIQALTDDVYSPSNWFYSENDNLL